MLRTILVYVYYYNTFSLEPFHTTSLIKLSAQHLASMTFLLAKGVRFKDPGHKKDFKKEQAKMHCAQSNFYAHFEKERAQVRRPSVVRSISFDPVAFKTVAKLGTVLIPRE